MAEKSSNAEQSVKLFASVSPHLRDVLDLRRVMWWVNLALVPATIAALYYFRGAALMHIVICIVTCVVVEAAIQKWRGMVVTVSDGSAVLTGLLLALNLPPEVPWWMGVFGGAFAIAVAKHCFGGLGYNIFNPALAARGFLLIAFAGDMSSAWAAPGTGTGLMNAGLTPLDAYSGATALDALKQLSRQGAEIQLDWEVLKNLLIGRTGGSLGETSALFLLIGGVFLLYKRVITWHIPISYCGSVLIIGFIHGLATGGGWLVPIFHLLAGGLILGAFYMATDLVTSPVTKSGRIIFGVGCGVLTMLIRIFGGYPEGVSFAILLMNCATPLLDRYTRPKAFGTSTLKQQEAAAK